MVNSAPIEEIKCAIEFQANTFSGVNLSSPAVQVYGMDASGHMLAYSDHHASAASILDGSVKVSHRKRMQFEVALTASGLGGTSCRVVFLVVRAGPGKHLCDLVSSLRCTVGLATAKRSILRIDSVDMSGSLVDWFVIGAFAIDRQKIISPKLFFKEVSSFPNHSGNIVPQLKELGMGVLGELEASRSDGLPAGWTLIQGDTGESSVYRPVEQVTRPEHSVEPSQERGASLEPIPASSTDLERDLAECRSRCIELEEKLTASSAIIDRLRTENRELRVNALAGDTDFCQIVENVEIPPNVMVVDGDRVDVTKSIAKQVQYQESVVNELKTQIKRIKALSQIGNQFHGLRAVIRN